MMQLIQREPKHLVSLARTKGLRTRKPALNGGKLAMGNMGGSMLMEMFGFQRVRLPALLTEALTGMFS
jgi:hypothetical protein